MSPALRGNQRRPTHRAITRIVVATVLAPALAIGVLPVAAATVTAAAPTAAVTNTARIALVSPAAANARIARVLPTRIKAKPLGTAVSVEVAEAAGGRSIWARSSLVPRLPASNMKLVTAVTAMTVLGVTTTLPTRVVTAAANRDLVLVAGGDPLLTSANLRSLAGTTVSHLMGTLPSPQPSPAAVPTTVAFTVHVDDSLFAAPSAAPGWTKGYVPSVVRPVRALVRDQRSGSDTSADAATYFTAQVAAALTARLAVSRPDLRASVTYRGHALKPPTSSTLATYGGHSVRSALSDMLLVSDNNIAEMMFRLSAVGSGRPATWAGGRAAATATMAKLGIRTAGLALVDGSGVSRSDRVTTTSLIQLLQAAVSPRNPRLSTLRAMLPVAGKTGTLKASNGRFTTAPTRCARGKIVAKTGTLHDVVALSGYTRGTDGRLKVFSILVNKRPERTYSALATRKSVDALAATVTGCF